MQRLGQRRMAVAERRHADAGVEVEEAIAVGVDDDGAFAAFEREPGELRDLLDARREIGRFARG